jgi:hypothetical protein
MGEEKAVFHFSSPSSDGIRPVGERRECTDFSEVEMKLLWFQRESFSIFFLPSVSCFFFFII